MKSYGGPQVCSGLAIYLMALTLATEIYLDYSSSEEVR